MKRRPRSQAINNEKVDLMFREGLLASCLLNARLDAELTLRELADRTGISHSEISKIESGDRQCRVESFAHICSATGLTVGRVIDEITMSGSALFDAVLNDPDFVELAERRGIQGGNREFLSMNLGACSALALHLVRCSFAVRIAARIQYPVADLRVRFQSFAGRVDSIEGSAERFKLATALRSKPVESLTTQGILSEEFIAHVLAERFELSGGGAGVKYFGKPKKTSAGGVVWLPFANAAEEDAEFSVDNLRESVTLEPVTPTWDQVVERARTATSEPGSKGKLAELIGVPQSRLSEWLGGKYEPGAGVAFKLLREVEKLEKIQKRAVSADTPTAQATRTERPQGNEPSQSEPSRESRGQRKKSTPPSR